MTGVEPARNVMYPVGIPKIENQYQQPLPDMPYDSIELSGNAPVPEIGFFRLLFGYLTPEQIRLVNESKKLPPNAKFVQNGYGGFTLANNNFNLRIGTRNLPPGFELRRNIFGFTVVVPTGSEGLGLL